MSPKGYLEPTEMDQCSSIPSSVPPIKTPSPQVEGGQEYRSTPLQTSLDLPTLGVEMLGCPLSYLSLNKRTTKEQ